MSIFGSIMQKIVNAAEATLGEAHAASQTPTAATPPAAIPAAATPAAATPAAAPATATEAAPAAAPAQNVDVEAVLTQMASQKGGGGNWQSSIVDLLKLLDLDSSLAARKQLADELAVHTGADGSAEENIALHQAVMRKLAENGGKVPDALKG